MSKALVSVARKGFILKALFKSDHSNESALVAAELQKNNFDLCEQWPTQGELLNNDSFFLALFVLPLVSNKIEPSIDELQKLKTGQVPVLLVGDYESIIALQIKYFLNYPCFLLATPFRPQEVSLLISSLTKTCELYLDAMKKTIDQTMSGTFGSISELSSYLTHEIRNPLGAAELRIALLQETITEEPFNKEQALSDLNDLRSICQRISQIVTALKRLTKRSKDEPKTLFLIDHLIKDIKTLCGHFLLSSGVKFNFSVETEETELWCNPTGIIQVLLNLINNAKQEVTKLEEKWIEVKVIDAEVGWVRFQVIDSGKGIPLELQEKIFSTYFTLRSKEGGSGLGLSLARSIIRLHGSDLKIDPDSSNTCFYFDIPTNPIGESNE